MFKNIFTKKNIVLFFVLFVLISLSMIIKSVYNNGDLNHTVIIGENNFSSNEKIDLFKGIYIKEEFKSKHNNLGIVSLKFDTHSRINNDFLEFRIREKDLNEWFYSANYKVDQFQNNKYFPFGFPEINNSENKVYEFQIKSLGGVDNDFVSVNTDNSKFLAKYSFSKNYLLSNKDQIPKFILYKIESIFNYLGLKYCLFNIIFSIVLVLSLNIINNIFNKYNFYEKSKIIKSIVGFTKNKSKKNIYEYLFIFISFLIFIYLLFNPQKLHYDAGLYYNLGSDIYNNGFNVLNTDLLFRTYGFPLFISVLFYIANLLSLDILSFIFIVNYLLFIFSIFLIYKVLVKKNIKVANIFLVLNSVNLVNLSFVNTVLTESLMIFVVSLLFSLLLAKKSKINIILLGFVLAFSVMIRPSNLILFIICSVYVLYKYKKEFLYWFLYLIPVIFVFSFSILNVYRHEGKISLFTTTTNGIYDMQIKKGVESFKYETSVDINLKKPSIWYENLNYKNYSSLSCSGSFNCLITYFANNPIEYLSIFSIHFFTLFDRLYMNTYVENIYKTSPVLIFYNYFVLSAFVCFLIFSIKDNLKNYIKEIFVSLLLFFGIILIYIPTVIESRFSSPVFPLITIFSSVYLLAFIKEKNKIKMISIQFLLIFIFYVVSYLVSQTIVIPV